MSRRITIVTSGSRGDIQPLLALAPGFKRAEVLIEFFLGSVINKVRREQMLDAMARGSLFDRHCEGRVPMPRPIARRKLTVESLAAAFIRITSDQHMRAATAELAGRLRRENGTDVAVRFIEAYFNNPASCSPPASQR